MNKRKIVLMAAALCMVAILGMGSTLAYLTDDEQITNTFTLGDVEINIEEFDYEGNVIGEYTDGTMLNPLDNAQGLKLYNKMVRTYNTSPSQNNAYIRTFVLFEKNTMVADNYQNEAGCCFPGIHMAHNTLDGQGADGRKNHASKVFEVLDETVTVEDVEYWVVVYVAADEKAIPYDEDLYSLCSVWVDKGIDDEIDGWGEDGIQVLVYSQAVQAEGLDHAGAMDALGKITVANVEAWLAGDVEAGVVKDLPAKAAN